MLINNALRPNPFHTYRDPENRTLDYGFSCDKHE
jgi:hypothetical protein